MTPMTLLRRAALACSLMMVVPLATSAGERREKIAVMKVDAPSLHREEVSSLRDRLEVGVTRAVGTRLQVITKDSAAASVGGGDKLLACMEGASCDAEIGGALGVDYFVSASVRQTALGLELGVTLLRIGRDVSLLRKDVKVFRSMGELLEGTSSHAEIVTRTALGGLLGRPAAQASSGAFGETGKDLVLDAAEEVVVAFESTPDGATVLVDGAVLCKETPCRKRIAVGAHEASFERERYGASVQRFTATKGAVVKGTLAPRFGWVSVETVPRGVTVAIDGADAGASPMADREVDEGTVEIAISDRCWLRAGERVAVKGGERKVVKLAAKPRLAGLKVNAEDEKGNAVDGDVKVDGEVAGVTGEVLKVPVCSKKVTVALGKKTFEGELKLEEGKVTVVTAVPGARPAAGGMVRLPGGTFKMGSRPDTVTVSPFDLDVTAVTVVAYGRCVKAGRCSAPETGNSCNWSRADRANHPINCVDWNQATAYCDWARKRLPTEEEREWAARGGENATTYPWGNTEPADQLCWSGGSVNRYLKNLGTCEVGSFPAGDSPQGLKDLAGNVWEWTSSAWGAGTWKVDPSNRVVRGGAWNGQGSGFAAGYRLFCDPARRYENYGFRCARTP